MSTSVAKITRHYQVVIPVGIRRKSGLKEGDLVSFEEKDGEIVMSPVRLIKKDQAYFWTKEWTLGEFLQRGYDKFADLEGAKKRYACREKDMEEEEVNKFKRG